MSRLFSSVYRPSTPTHMQERRYGFSTGRSPILRLLMTLSGVHSNIQNAECVTLLLFDFQKAFDTIKHDNLLKKNTIQKLDLSAEVYKLLESYSINRYLSVQIDDALSESSKVAKGVPQGFFLGLFFFVFFIDDLPNDIVYFSSYLFADDFFSLYTGFNNPANRLKSNSCQLQTWSDCTMLFFNAEKCQHLILKGSLGFEPEQYNEK